MSRLTERRRLFLTILVSVLATGGLLVLVFRDRSEIDGVKEEITGLEQRIRAADTEIRKTKDREDKVLVFRAVENRELAVLPTRQKIASFHRNLSTFLASAGLRFQELPESKPQESGLAPGIFVTRSTIAFQGDASSTLKFINMMEDDPRLVAVKGLSIDAGTRPKDDEAAPVVHDVELTIETYYYNPTTDGSDRVHIPNAEARLQEDGIREAIASFQPERPDTYVLRPSGSRRDPLVDPRRRRAAGDEAGLEELLRAQETIVLELETQLDDVNEKYEQEKALINAGDPFRSDRVGREVDDLLNELRAHVVQVSQRKSVTIPELNQRLAQVEDRIEYLRGRRPPREMTIPKALAERTLQEVQEHFDAGDYAEVASLTSQWAQYIEGRQVEGDALPFVERIAALRPRAKVLSEFHSIPLRVTGTIVHPMDPARSIALVNGRPMHIGQALDERGDVTVSGIERDSVTFAYEGESIRVKRRQGEADEKPRGTRGGIQPVQARVGGR